MTVLPEPEACRKPRQTPVTSNSNQEQHMDTINIDNKPPDPSRSTEKFLLSDIQTRLALVEHSQTISKEERKEIKEYLVKIDEKLDKTNESVAHYKGKLGGIILAISAVGTALATFWDQIIRFLKGG